MGGLMFEKPRPKALDKRDRAADVQRESRDEDRKVRQRSGGQCEVREQREMHDLKRPYVGWFRCRRIGSEVHHLRGGIGRRNHGDSIKAEHKLHTCSICHAEITRHILVPVGEGREDAASVVYERVR